ncbi:hypothetical protein [Acinetobacter pittii]|uniref:hypothetical protein n=1 Tax=Acinetobacter pittii TaxID=48296 RepID=UPI002DBF2DA4|nr:hypothetical protein [Acinetobacter pittii]MEB7640513.1 hypothetical protein [Acinetobacter pittii]
MDHTLKTAYAALEKWKKTVTVKKFVEDNKRLNGSHNPNSPTLSNFLQSSSMMQAVSVQKSLEILFEDYSEHYIKLLSISHKNQLDYFLKKQEVISQIAMIERNFNHRKALSKNTADSVISIVVHSKNTQTHLIRQSERAEQKKIKDLLSFDDKPHSKSVSSNQMLKYLSQPLCSV